MIMSEIWVFFYKGEFYPEFKKNFKMGWKPSKL